MSTIARNATAVKTVKTPVIVPDDDEYDDAYAPYHEYQPTHEDRASLYADESDPDDSLPLFDWVTARANFHRARGTARDRWLAWKLDELAQLITWTGATTTEDHDDRMEIYDRELRDRYYHAGRSDANGRGD